MKKTISTILCVLMIFCFSVTAGADEYDDALTSFEYEEMADGTIKVTRFDSLDQSFDIPSEINGKKVTVIGKKAFRNCGALRSITVPDTVITIEDYAFDSCTKLQTVTLGQNVESLGFRAFGDCKVLKNINFPSSLKNIGKNCFMRCYALQKVHIPKSVTSIGDYAFGDCSHIESLTFEDGEFTIGEYAFSWCLSVPEIKLGKNVKEIQKFAFFACDKAATVTIENENCIIADSVYTLPETATICAYDGSTAQKYATAYNRNFISLTPAFTPFIGDSDKDGFITIVDATLIQKYLSSQAQLDDHAKANSDTDKDGEISILDSTQIQRFLALLIDTL